VSEKKQQLHQQGVRFNADREGQSSGKKSKGGITSERHSLFGLPKGQRRKQARNAAPPAKDVIPSAASKKKRRRKKNKAV